MKTIICLSLIVVCALQVTSAKNPALDNIVEHNHAAPSATSTVELEASMPDLIVRGNEFEFVGNKMVNVYVSNNGNAPSKRCVLELTVRKIGGVSAGRTTTAIIPPLQPGKYA